MLSVGDIDFVSVPNNGLAVNFPDLPVTDNPLVLRHNFFGNFHI